MRKPPLLLLTFCVTLLCHSQSGLYISGTTLSIRANTILAVDGLVLTPSTSYSFTGSNHLTRRTTLLHPSVTPSINRSFQWATTLPAFTGSIGLYYDDSELNGLAEADLTLNIHDGTHWQAYRSGASRNAVTNVVTTPVSGLLINELSLAAEAHPLPLKWGRITATRQGLKALVEWQTYQEEQTAYFEVERSIDGFHWSQTGQALLARNSPGTHVYRYLDRQLPTAKTYYRIKQVDTDGQARYSSIVWVPALYELAPISIYPNPAGLQLTLQSGSLPIQAFRLYSANGKLLRTETVTPATTHTFPLSSIPAGVYMIQVQLADGSLTNHSFIKN